MSSTLFFMLMPIPASKSSQTPFKNVILTQFKTNHDFQKSRFSKIGRKIMKISEIGIFFARNPIFTTPGSQNRTWGKFYPTRSKAAYPPPRETRK